MIRQIVHKGLERFYLTGDMQGIQVKHARKLKLILDRLDNAVCVDDIKFPGSDLHPLKGKMKHLWSVSVSANWRVTFSFIDGDAFLIDYQDYH